MKKFENIYIASDIDSTFTWKANYINEKNYEKVLYFIENGGHFSFSTGRNAYDTGIVVPRWREICNMPLVLCNGGFMYEPKTGKLINARYLQPSERAVELFAAVRKNFGHIAGVRVSYPDGFIIDEDDTTVIENLRSIGVDEKIITKIPLEKMRGDDWFKLVVCTEPERRDGIRDYIEKHFGREFSITYSAPTLVEMQPYGVSKAYQLSVLRDNIRKENPNARLYCIGDYENDYQMLSMADVAACPANATERIKALCSVHLCHCEDGAVGELIEKIEESL